MLGEELLIIQKELGVIFRHAHLKKTRLLRGFCKIHVFTLHYLVKNYFFCETLLITVNLHGKNWTL